MLGRMNRALSDGASVKTRVSAVSDDTQVHHLERPAVRACLSEQSQHEGMPDITVSSTIAYHSIKN